MLQVNIHQTFGMIGVRYQSGQWNLSAPNADLEIHRTNPAVSFQRMPGELDVNQTEAFSDEGRKSPLSFNQDFAAQAKTAAMNAVADNAAFGDQVLRSKNVRQAERVVVQHEIQRALPQRDVAPALVPRPFSVQIHYTLSQLHADFQPGQLNIQANIQPVRVTDFAPANAEVYLQQPPSITITTSETGQNFDKNA